MGKYRKKPVVIEAVQLTDETLDEARAFLAPVIEQKSLRDYHGKIQVAIPTLEGVMVGSEGDYIIKGIKGEFYPCRGDIFHETYDEVKEGEGNDPSCPVHLISDLTYVSQVIRFTSLRLKAAKEKGKKDRDKILNVSIYDLNNVADALEREEAREKEGK